MSSTDRSPDAAIRLALVEFWVPYSQALYNFVPILAGLIGLPLIYVRTIAAHRQARTAEQGHITDRFTNALELFGSDKLPVRVGAVYALERISRDSRRDNWTIMERRTYASTRPGACRKARDHPASRKH